MSKKIDSRLPNDIGQGQLPSHAAIKTPWEKLISIHDAHYFMTRHRAGIASVYMQMLRILIPDYEERCQRLCDVTEQFFTYVFSKEGYNQSEAQAKRLNIHPFMRGAFNCGLTGDGGDEGLWMCGRVADFGTHRIEKELDTCPWDIMGSEVCRISTWSGMEVIGNEFARMNGGGPKMRITMYEALGCGDAHCRIVGESYEKYPMPPRAKWDNFGPIATEDQIKYTPEEKSLKDCQIYRDECNFTYRNGLCMEYTAGDGTPAGYETGVSTDCNDNYISLTLNDMIAKGEVTREYVDLMLTNLFESCGKMMFLDYYAVKAVRDWMGVPNDINDGRVMGAYIEIYLQGLKCAYDIIAFNEEEVIYDIDARRFSLTSPYYRVTYLALWYGMLRSMVNCRWSIWEEEGAPEGKFRVKIAKKIDKRAH